MTFLAGWRLLFLLIPVALVVAYLLTARNRQRVAARFATTDLLASVVPRRSGWQRHLPWAALALAMIVGVLGFAQPSLAVLVPKERATVVLTLDTSRSMDADDVSPTRLAAAKAAARQFIDGLPSGLQVGLVTFDGDARLVQSPSDDRAALQTAIETIQLGDGTGTAGGIDMALTALESVPADGDGNRPPGAVVLMSDGTPTVGLAGVSPEQAVADQAERAAAMSVAISTIAFGTDDGVVTVEGQTIPVPADPEALSGIAESTGGQAFTAESAAELDSVYDTIGSAIGYDREETDVSAWFAGLAFLLAALAAAAALMWTQQLA